ncbi:hypothetical protein NMY22_g4972 [Coprinellus aureogranulatus]|nr:hypothetical protein NMY22_g4972 [Coprinellus aureogranulatus]
MSDASAQNPVSVESFEGEKTGRYIVLLKEDTTQADVLSGISNVNSLELGSAVTHQWDLINGFAGNFDRTTLAALQATPGVASIVEEGIIHALVSTSGEPWGLARISSEHRLAGPDTALIYTYTYDARAGQGVDIYIIDTGVRITHVRLDELPPFLKYPPTDMMSSMIQEDFGGRATGDLDGNGHGTHCAAIAAGTKYGVAKLASIRSIKVLQDNGSGSTADIISGLNRALTQSNASGRPSVVSLSLGGAPNSALDAAVRAVRVPNLYAMTSEYGLTTTKRTQLVAAGIHVAVAAGGSNSSSETSPARVAEAVTVGASTILDERAPFSNFGPLIDVFAPGVNITSASNASDTATATLSGTSLSAPHVAGLLAYLISVHGNASPFNLSHTLKDIAFKGALNPLTLPPGTSNLLISNIATT